MSGEEVDARADRIWSAVSGLHRTRGAWRRGGVNARRPPEVGKGMAPAAARYLMTSWQDEWRQNPAQSAARQ